MSESISVAHEGLLYLSLILLLFTFIFTKYQDGLILGLMSFFLIAVIQMIALYNIINQTLMYISNKIVGMFSVTAKRSIS